MIPDRSDVERLMVDTALHSLGQFGYHTLTNTSRKMSCVILLKYHQFMKLENLFIVFQD